MKTYSYFEAQQNYSMVLNTALVEDVVIRKKEVAPVDEKSPFDVAGIHADITRQDILDVVKEGRGRSA
jgi:hypothetical protein